MRSLRLYAHFNDCIIALSSLFEVVIRLAIEQIKMYVHRNARGKDKNISRINKENQWKICKYEKICLLLQRHKSIINMSYTENITIKNPSRKLEEYLRDVGVKKYLWLQKLRSDDMQPTKILHV